MKDIVSLEKLIEKLYEWNKDNVNKNRAKKDVFIKIKKGERILIKT